MKMKTPESWSVFQEVGLEVGWVRHESYETVVTTWRWIVKTSVKFGCASVGVFLLYIYR